MDTPSSRRAEERSPSLRPASQTPSNPGWDYGDAVAAAVSVLAGVYDDRVDQLVADLSGEPFQMAHVVVVDIAGQLHLDRKHAPV